MVSSHRRPRRPPCRCGRLHSAAGLCPEEGTTNQPGPFDLGGPKLCAPIPTEVTVRSTAMGPAFPPVPKNCTVTGGMGFVGRRLVEMLVERGAQRVVAFDIAPKPDDAGDDPRIVWMQGDLTNPADVEKACAGSECVWHIAALVGPYHPLDLYMKVNYEGTLNVINACKSLGIRKIVMSSSPSTRFDGKDINGKRESELQIPDKFLQEYAESKARGEQACMAACDGKDLLTVAIAPHQVYGPRDFLFLHNFLLNAKRLRVFGPGDNLVSVCYVDNYCHGLIIGERALYPGSPALKNFYICTDGQLALRRDSGDWEPVKLWPFIDRALMEILGQESLFKKFKLPGWSFMYPLGRICEVVGYLMGKKLKLTTFSVRMLLINRYFNGDAARDDLKYEPIVKPDEAWKRTLTWFKKEWLPKYGPK